MIKTYRLHGIIFFALELHNEESETTTPGFFPGVRE